MVKSDDRAFREAGMYDGRKKRSGIESSKIQIPPKGSGIWHVGGTQPSLLRTAGEAVLSGAGGRKVFTRERLMGVGLPVILRVSDRVWPLASNELLKKRF